MLEEANKPRSAVNWSACFTAAAVATSLVGATVASADDDDHWKKRRRHHHSPPYYVVAPPVAYYAPRPIVYFTLGTIFNLESGDLFERALKGLCDLPTQGPEGGRTLKKTG